MHGDTERDWAMRLGVKRAVDGWLGTYAKGVDERRARAERAPASEGKRTTSTPSTASAPPNMRSTGGMALTLECGQHDDPNGPEVAYRAIRNTLALFGLTDDPLPAAATDMEGLHLGTVVDKFDRDDAFARPWQSFDALKADDVIGTRASGEVVRAPRDGYIVFPNALAEANYEWFYLAEATGRFNPCSHQLFGENP